MHVTLFSVIRLVTTLLLRNSHNVVSQIVSRERDSRTGKFVADDFASQLPSSRYVCVVEV